MLIVLLGISLLYYFKILQFDIASFNGLDFVQRLLQANIRVPLWYLYLYLAYLFMLPVLRKMAQGMDSNGFIYLTLIYAAVRLLSAVAVLFPQWQVAYYFTQGLFTSMDIVYYPLAGHYFENVLCANRYNRKNFIASLATIVGATVVGAILASINGRLQDDATSQLLHGTMTVWNTLSVFYATKYLSKKSAEQGRLQKQ